MSAESLYTEQQAVSVQSTPAQERIDNISFSKAQSLNYKILGAITSGVMIVGSIAATEYINTGEAQAQTITFSDLGYPWASAPCQFGDAGGAQCLNPNDPKKVDKYDWGVYDDNHIFHPYRDGGYEYRNCTDYVKWKEGTIGVSVPNTWGNGGEWYGHASASQKSDTPEVGDAAVKPVTASDGFGHVAYVESVNGDGTITISEYNHDAQGHGDMRTGKASDMGFTQFVDFGVHPSDTTAGNGNAAKNTDGAFLHTTDTNNIYEMVGGAPVRQYNWGVLPEFHGQATDVSQAQINAMPAYPQDGTFVNIQEAGGNGVYEFAGGAPIRQYNWGYLKGFNPANVRNINYRSLASLDHMRLTPADGTFVNIHEANGNGIYEFVGGAPVRQFNWGYLRGFPGSAITDINYASLQNLDHMHAVPNNGSFMNISEAGGNGVYEFIGGAPLRQYNWGVLPNFPRGAIADVNYQSLVQLDHMNSTPSDGTFVSIQEAGGNGIYEFVGGAPLRQFNWGILPGFNLNMPTINYQSLVELDHMHATPIDGAFIASAETGTVYRTAGGASLRLYNQGAMPGYNGAIYVNQATIDTADHQLAVPANGTILEGVSTQTFWQIEDGKRIAVARNGNAVIVDEQTVADIPMQ